MTTEQLENNVSEMHGEIDRLRAINADLLAALKNLYAQAKPFNHTGDAIWKAVKAETLAAIAKAQGKA